MRLSIFPLSTVAISVLFVPTAKTQAPPADGGARPVFQFSGGIPDPGVLFDTFAKGQSKLTRDMMPAPMQRIWDQHSPGKDSYTREEFIARATEVTAQFRKNNPNVPNYNGPPINLDPDAMAMQRFKQMDKDGDGRLSFEEMSETLRAARDKYDTNKDGFIDFAEYKVFFNDRMKEWSARTGIQPTMIKPDSQGDIATGSHDGEAVEEPRVKVLRVGKLPKEIPDWFIEMDRNGDNDGQVGLYEWRKAGRPIVEFRDWDLNDDGFITPEEVLKVLKKNPDLIAKADETRGSFGNNTEAPSEGLESNPAFSLGVPTALHPHDGQKASSNRVNTKQHDPGEYASYGPSKDKLHPDKKGDKNNPKPVKPPKQVDE